MNLSKKIKKLIFPLLCLSSFSCLSLSSCGNTIYIQPIYVPETVVINNFDSIIINCDKDQSYTIDWDLNATIYPLTCDQRINWSIQDPTPNKNIRIVNNKIHWDSIGGESQYQIKLIATSIENPEIKGEKSFIVNTIKDHQQSIVINNNDSGAIYCDADSKYIIDWVMSGSIYPSSCDQRYTWSIEDNTPNKSIKIDDTSKKIYWNSIGEKGVYEFKLIATSVESSSITTFKTFTIDTTKDKPSSDDYFNYIAQRTLSVTGFKMVGQTANEYTSGTMWFYKRLNDSDYCYEFITNYHVYESLISMISSTSTALLALRGNQDANNPYRSFITDAVPTFNGYTETTFNPIFLYLGTFTDPLTEETKDLYMDMCAIKLDLTFAMNQSKNLANQAKGVSQFKEEVNYINDHYAKGENIVNISNVGATTDEQVYIAGYPWQNSNIESDPGQNITYLTETKPSVNSYYQAQINALSNSTYYTRQDEYKLNGYDVFALGGGASGSMVVNENFETVGIYWGGWWEKDDPKFYPNFGKFTLHTGSETFDFIDYVNNKI